MRIASDARPAVLTDTPYIRSIRRDELLGRFVVVDCEDAPPAKG
jgi:hypothetical protein